MKKVFTHPLWSILIIPVLGMVYTVINREPLQIRTLYTDLDHAIPFIKHFIIPYMVWMPFMYATFIYFYIKDRRLYFRTLLAYSVSVLICYMIYMLYQTTVPRSDVPDGGLLNRMVMFVYRHDAPFNCFPSIHCLSSYLLFLAASKSKAIRPSVVAVIGIVAWIIIVSTVFVKQHVVMDVFGGIVLGHIVFTLLSAVSRSSSRNVSYL